MALISTKKNKTKKKPQHNWNYLTAAADGGAAGEIARGGLNNSSKLDYVVITLSVDCSSQDRN